MNTILAPFKQLREVAKNEPLAAALAVVMLVLVFPVLWQFAESVSPNCECTRSLHALIAAAVGILTAGIYFASRRYAAALVLAALLVLPDGARAGFQSGPLPDAAMDEMIHGAGQSADAGPAVGVCAVIVVAGALVYAGVLFVRACNRIAGSHTNKLEEATGGASFAAINNLEPCGSCVGEQPAQDVFVVGGRFEGDRFVMTAPVRVPPEETMSFHDAQSYYWTNHGVELASWAATPFVSYGLNGQPSDASRVPISFFPPGLVTIGTFAPYTVQFQVKDDLSAPWQNLGPAVRWNPEVPLRFSDVSNSPARFYRARFTD